MASCDGEIWRFRFLIFKYVGFVVEQIFLILKFVEDLHVGLFKLLNVQEKTLKKLTNEYKVKHYSLRSCHKLVRQ